MFYLLGVAIAIASLVASIVHLGQGFASYFDFVGFTMVVGGTFATALITLPWDLNREIFWRLRELLYRTLPNKRRFLNTCMELSQSVARGNYNYVVVGRSLPFQILRDGLELIQLGFTLDKIEMVLRERLIQGSDRTKYVANCLRSLSKYPPAFGLAGTVLGLVHLMRGVSDGMSPKETGIRMAIALIATFYGLLVSNLVVNPAGEAVHKHGHEEEKMGEIALQAVMLAAERTNLLETQEMLNSFVEVKDRVDMIQAAGETVVGAA